MRKGLILIIVFFILFQFVFETNANERLNFVVLPEGMRASGVFFKKRDEDLLSFLKKNNYSFNIKRLGPFVIYNGNSYFVMKDLERYHEKDTIKKKTKSAFFSKDHFFERFCTKKILNDQIQTEYLESEDGIYLFRPDRQHIQPNPGDFSELLYVQITEVYKSEDSFLCYSISLPWSEGSRVAYRLKELVKRYDPRFVLTLGNNIDGKSFYKEKRLSLQRKNDINLLNSLGTKVFMFPGKNERIDQTFVDESPNLVLLKSQKKELADGVYMFIKKDNKRPELNFIFCKDPDDSCIQRYIIHLVSSRLPYLSEKDLRQDAVLTTDTPLDVVLHYGMVYLFGITEKDGLLSVKIDAFSIRPDSPVDKDLRDRVFKIRIKAYRILSSMQDLPIKKRVHPGNVAARILLVASSSDVALIPSFDLSMEMSPPYSGLFFASNLSDLGDIVIYRIRGDALFNFLKKHKKDFVQGYHKKTNRIDGMRIDKKQFYQLATTMDLAKEIEGSSYLSKIADRWEMFSIKNGELKKDKSGERVSLKSLVLDFLSSKKKSYILRIINRDFGFLPRSRFYLNLDDIGLTFDSYKNLLNNDAYKKIGDVWATTENSLAYRFVGTILAGFANSIFDLSLRLDADFGKTILTDEVQETQDDLIYTAEFIHNYAEAISFSFFRLTPYTDIILDTEFTPQVGLEKEKRLHLDNGVIFDLLDGYSKYKLAFVLYKDLSNASKKTDFGFTANILHRKKFGKNTVKLYSTILYLFPHPESDTESDLGLKANAGFNFSTKIKKDLWAEIFVEVHWIRGRVKSTAHPLVSYSAGLKLSYSRFIKFFVDE